MIRFDATFCYSAFNHSEIGTFTLMIVEPRSNEKERNVSGDTRVVFRNFPSFHAQTIRYACKYT